MSSPTSPITKISPPVIPEYNFNQIEINNWDEFQSWINSYEKLKTKQKLTVYFKGSNTIEGQSWNEQCRIIDGKLKETIRKFRPKNQTLLWVSVGSMREWEDDKNINNFKKDEIINLNKLPTFLVWNSQKRLEDFKEMQDIYNLNTVFLY